MRVQHWPKKQVKRWDVVRYGSNVFFPTKVLFNPFPTAGIFLIYISTDYVFDGRNPPYGENDAPNPLNLYGKSKLEGEREILRHCPGIFLF